MDEQVRRADSMSSNADGLDLRFARAQRGEPAALDGLLRAVFPTAQCSDWPKVRLGQHRLERRPHIGTTEHRFGLPIVRAGA